MTCGYCFIISFTLLITIFFPFVYVTKQQTSSCGEHHRFICLPEWRIVECRVPKYYDFRIIMTSKLLWLSNYYETLGMGSPNCGRLDVWSYNLFTILIVNTELYHPRFIKSVNFIFCSYLVMRKKKMIKTKFYSKDVVR